jgi:maltose alpha-D-glucosyltransferase/alpha-amylase
VFSRNRFPSIREGTPYFITLGAHDCEWFVLEKVNSLVTEGNTLPMLDLMHWSDFPTKSTVEKLETKILEPYLCKMRWFGGKGRGVEDIKILEVLTLSSEGQGPRLMLLEIRYASGLPEMYQLPVAFATGPFAQKLIEGCPKSVIAKIRTEESEGVLYDAIYGLELQEFIIHRMANQDSIRINTSELIFTANDKLKDHVWSQEKIKPRVLGGEQSNTSIIYDNRYFLKLFRKVERAINPDVEITKFLTEVGKFQNVPAFVGAIEWRYQKEPMILGLMQEMVESSGDAWTYMLDRLDDFNETILAKTDLQAPPPLRGSLINPIEYEDIPMSIKELLEASVADRVFLLGVRTGEMHRLLEAGTQPEFKPEPYSLHYQRSLYSGLQSLVRSTFENQVRNMKKLSETVRKEADHVLSMRGEILSTFKRIYEKKIDVVKIRIHGDYHLGQVLFTGKDFVITDFEGEPARSLTERRLKRSPLRDVAGMIRSFHYAAYGSLFLDNQIRQEDHVRLIPFIEQWYHYMSGIFMHAYLETVRGSSFIPKDKNDLEILMTTFLLEKSVYELNYELNNRPDWVIIPLRGIQAILQKSGLPEIEVATV